MTQTDALAKYRDRGYAATQACSRSDVEYSMKRPGFFEGYRAAQKGEPLDADFGIAAAKFSQGEWYDANCASERQVAYEDGRVIATFARARGRSFPWFDHFRVPRPLLDFAMQLARDEGWRAGA